jgi:hypothetical protein
LQTIHVGHADVDDHQVDGQRFEMLAAGRRDIDNKQIDAAGLQPCLNERANGWVVVDDEDERQGYLRF